LTETGAGLLLALGVLTPLATAALIGVMVNAIGGAHWKNGLWVTDGGYEYPLVLAVLAAGVALSGPGAYSVDHVIQRATTAWHPWGFGWGLVAIAAGLGAGLVLLATRRPASTTATESGQAEAQHRRAA
jgi:putative oxidoreductase